MKCPACASDLTEDASYCPACLRSLPRTPSPSPESGSSTDLGGWETVLAGVLLLVVILSAVLLLG